MGVHVSCCHKPPSHLPPHPIPLGCLRAPALCALLHSSNLYWSSILHMVIYMFQCCSFTSSHPCLLPHNPKVCSLHLCFFCYLAYRVIVTIFLNSIYMKFRKMILTILHAGQQRKHRCKEQTFGLSGRRRRWEDLREHH